jgi:hypothetical protein
MKTPYEAGYDAGKNGPNMENCNFSWFATPEMTREWERGNNEAKANS